jgi:hypothetical protein
MTVLWNQGVQTDREVLANRPDIVVKYKEARTCLLSDVAMPSHRNVTEKEAEKKLKYKNKYINLANVEHEMLCHSLPVITGAKGTVSKV